MARTESFRPERFGVWLHVLSEAGDAFVAERLAALPVELLVLAVHRLVLVLDLDALAVELSDAGEDGAYTEKALESVLFEEWEEFRLIARDHGTWDVLWAALVSLDRDHHALLRDAVERCAALDAECIEDNGSLYDVLTSEEMLEGDLAAERGDRRAERGHLAPADARAFLKLAATGEGATMRDPISAAYFRELSKQASSPASKTSRAPAREPAMMTRADASHDLKALAQLLADAKVTEEPGHASTPLPALLAGGPAHFDATGKAASTDRDADLLRSALAELFAVQPGLASERLEELAYLSNVLIAGSAQLGRRPRPIEALESAVHSCGVGLELALRDTRFAAPDLPGLGPVASLLARTTLDLLFRLASAKRP